MSISKKTAKLWVRKKNGPSELYKAVKGHDVLVVVSCKEDSGLLWKLLRVGVLRRFDLGTTRSRIL